MLQRAYGSVAYGGLIPETLVISGTFDVLVITENVSLVQFSFISINSTLSITESITVSNSQSGNINVNDVLSITESLSFIQLSEINVNDALAITENVILTQFFNDINVNDVLLISESISSENFRFSPGATPPNLFIGK